MAQPEITVDQITAAPTFDGTNITGVAQLASSNTFTADQIIDSGGAVSSLEIIGSTGGKLRITKQPGGNSWDFDALNTDLIIGDSNGTAFRILSGTGGRPILEISNTDVSFDGKNLNRANVFSTSSNVSLTLTNASQYVRMTNGSFRSVTVPTNASVAFPIGTQIDIHRVLGAVTVIASGGVTINTPETLSLRKPHSTATLIKVGTDAWDLVGDLTFL